MPDFEINSLKKTATIHFIGIGGISMSCLAQIMINRGYKVTGSDWSKTHITDRLESLGATIFKGQQKENVNGADLVVFTAAAKEDNPEIIQAKEDNIPLLNRAQFLGAIMKEYENAIAIAGTHGKTTTTSMLSHALLKANTDATISIGGELDLIGGNVRVGNSDYFLTEACEYTNSFLNFFPKIAVITNIEEDHLDFFSGLTEIIESFKKFAFLTKDKGVVIACADDENVKKALCSTNLNIKYYSIDQESDYRATSIVYPGGFPEFDVVKEGRIIAHLKLNVPGKHNILNALACIGVCDMLCLPLDVVCQGICEFCGTHRRFEKKGIFNGSTIMDDYAHHPTEIKATIAAASNMQKNKLWCIFQPHTYSRTRTLWDDFTTCFEGVDELILADIYPAREVFDGVTKSEDLAKDIKKQGINVRYVDDFSKICDILKNELKENDLVFTMGAGDVYKIADKITKQNHEFEN